MHSAMSAVLAKADVLIVISSGSVDGARSASATLDWLDAHGHEDMVRNSIAVVNAVRPRSGKVDMQKVVDHFSRRCRAVRLVPFDPHLEEGAEISLDRLQAGNPGGADRTGGRGRRRLSGQQAIQRPFLGRYATAGGCYPRGQAGAGNPGRRPGRSCALRRMAQARVSRQPA